MTELKFPKGFLWGSATAAHQVEGHLRNDWTVWEKLNAQRLAHESEASFWWNPHWKDFAAEATDPGNYISGKGCDHYTRFEEDFDIAKKLHQSAYRFSIEWARIEPRPGVFDEREIEHYRKVLAALHKRKLEPFVTLFHFTLPFWLAEEGGVLSQRFPELFARYAKKIAYSLGKDFQFWVTINEPDVYAGATYMKGQWPPTVRNPWLYYRALRSEVRAHQLAYRAIKEVCPEAKVGIAKHNIWFEAAYGGLWNLFLKKLADLWWNHWFLKKISQEQDFIGLNHYNHHRIDGWFNQNENKVQTDFGWEFYPESLYHVAIDLIRYGKPIYITENGIADAKDTLRPRFIQEALFALRRALADGAPVKGYFYWSLLDNFEWDKGYWPRFGLVEIDRGTLERTLRPSAKLYAEIAKKNALTL